MSLFGRLDLAEFATIYRVAIASYGKAEPPAGSVALTMSEIGISSQGDETIFTSRNGRGKAIVAEFEGELVVGFRGTDKFNDYKDYDNIALSHKYFKQFQPLLEAVAQYSRTKDLDVTFTGLSLGGAVANIIADRADKGRWGGAFEDARFVGVASPYLSANRRADLFNFGFQNDPVYHILGHWGERAKEMATRHVYVYKSDGYFGDSNLDDRLGIHEPRNIGDFLSAISELKVSSGELLANVLTSKSYVLVDDVRGSVNAGRLRHDGDSVLTVIGEDRADKIYGATTHNGGSKREWMFGGGGNDDLRGRGGRDELYGGDGSDRLDGGRGVDLMLGGKGDDMIFLQDHGDSAVGGEGKDRFVLNDILPRNAKGEPSETGNNLSRVAIDDFVSGEDTIVLSRLDGNLARKGDQPLRYAGHEIYDDTDGLSALERGYVDDTRPGSVTVYEPGNGKTLVIVNLDNDRHREIEIVLNGTWEDIRGDLGF